MRKLALVLSVAAVAAVPYAAVSQEAAQPAPSADDFVCALSDECNDQATETEQPATPAGRPRLNATRGFSLSRPTAPPADTKAGQTRTQSSSQGNTQRRNQRQTASRPAQGQNASAAQAARRVDLRLAFGLGSSALSDAAQAQMRVFAEALRRPQLANARVRIEGHTDSSGGRAANLALSQKRAQAVADFLVSQGIAPSRLEVRGYAYDRPLPGRPASARENRRVEAVRIS